MHKQTMTFQNLEGKEVTESFYFNLNEREVILFQAQNRWKTEGGIEGIINGMIESENEEELFAFFEEMVRMSFGRKDEDGVHFLKSEAEAERFIQHVAYPKLFMKLMSEDGEMANFVNGMFPAEMQAEIKKAQKEAKASGKVPQWSIPPTTVVSPPAFTPETTTTE